MNAPEAEDLCDGCFFRCAGCAWAWTDEEFLEDGGCPSVLAQRDADARAALGMPPLPSVSEEANATQVSGSP